MNPTCTTKLYVAGMSFVVDGGSRGIWGLVRRPH